MPETAGNMEDRRLVLQAELDALKDQRERNRLGQFATPAPLALEILQYAREHLDESAPVRFIDPAIGTGTFYSALLNVFPHGSPECAVGYEIDGHYGLAAARLWGETALDVRVEDFTRATPPEDSEKFNLLVCNPPYVRHHHIPGNEKQRLKALIRDSCGIEFNGLAGLYCYFLGLCHGWMAEGGLAGWLIPSEFMDVNYGVSLKRYLLNEVTLLHVHRFDPNEVQFSDALVSSAVIWFRMNPPPPCHQVRMTYGGSLRQPRMERLVPVEALRRGPKWTQYPMAATRQEPDLPVLSDFFTIKRGVATGSNKYFILPADEIEGRGLPAEVFRPILPSPRYLPGDEILADKDGNPVLDRRLFLLDCRLPESEIEKVHPMLGEYLEEGKTGGLADRYLCRHRSPWYAQERRSAAPFLCTYLGRSDSKRGRPFRFILNHSQATAPNVYLMMYPKGSLEEALRESPQLKQRVWEFLKEIGPEEMLSEGRVYGGGLHKLEPKELGKVPAAALADLISQLAPAHREKQLALFGSASD